MDIQPANIRCKLSSFKSLIIGVDGMQPEKGNDCLYIAPLELGGIKIFDVLEDLESSVTRCQKKAITSYYAV